MKAYIKVARPTTNHKGWLESRGYKVALEQVSRTKYYVVECAGFADQLDLRGDKHEAEAELQRFTDAKLMLTYTSRVVTNKGEYAGIPAASVLGQASALMSRREPKKSGPTETEVGEQTKNGINAKIADLLRQGKLDDAKALADRSI